MKICWIKETKRTLKGSTEMHTRRCCGVRAALRGAREASIAGNLLHAEARNARAAACLTTYLMPPWQQWCIGRFGLVAV